MNLATHLFKIQTFHLDRRAMGEVEADRARVAGPTREETARGDMRVLRQRAGAVEAAARSVLRFQEMLSAGNSKVSLPTRAR